MKKAKTLLILLLLSLGTSFGQDNQQNTNNGYVTYNKIPGYREKYEKGFEYLVKLNPLLIINGDLPIYVEKRITSQFTIEASVGATLRDYIFDAVYEDPDLTYDYKYITERKHLVGYSFSLSGRFYPSDRSSALDGFYFAPEVRFRNYRSQALKCENTTSFFNQNYVNESRKVIDFKLTFGTVAYLTDRIFLEWYNGVGMRWRNIDQAYCYDAVIPAETVIFNEKDIRVIFSSGLKLGCAF